MINRLKIVALVLILGLSQTACYTSYFISKNELRKLESSVEQKDTVTVFGDCPGIEDSAPQKVEEETPAQAYRSLYGPLYAQADIPDDTSATDATSDDTSETSLAAPSVPPGCTAVDVSTNNSVVVKTKEGEKLRVTPFNFIMSERQIVSPEYDLLENLSDVDGAEVSQFSTWKTVGLIVGVTAAAVGTFVGVSLLAGDSTDFGSK